MDISSHFKPANPVTLSAPRPAPKPAAPEATSVNETLPAAPQEEVNDASASLGTHVDTTA